MHGRTMASMVGFACVGAAASACMVCDSPGGREARAAAIDADFGFNLASIAAPFPVMLAVAVSLSAALPNPRRRPDAPDSGR